MKTENSYILLEGLRFHARHGVLAQERLTGNDYIVTLRIGVDLGKAMESDDVADTLDYAAVYDAVREEMGQPSVLVEHVAGRIARRLMTDFEQIDTLRVKIIKKNPPMGADCEGAGVEIDFKR